MGGTPQGSRRNRNNAATPRHGGGTPRGSAAVDYSYASIVPDPSTRFYGIFSNYYWGAFQSGKNSVNYISKMKWQRVRTPYTERAVGTSVTTYGWERWLMRIGLPAQDGESPIDLLGQNQAHEAVRKSQGREGEADISARRDLFRQAVRATDKPGEG